LSRRARPARNGFVHLVDRLIAGIEPACDASASEHALVHLLVALADKLKCGINQDTRNFLRHTTQLNARNDRPAEGVPGERMRGRRE
jgi:hypothetical protein